MKRRGGLALRPNLGVAGGEVDGGRSDGEAAAHPVSLRINGEVHVADVGPQATLLDVLREHLLLTGSNKRLLRLRAAGVDAHRPGTWISLTQVAAAAPDVPMDRVNLAIDDSRLPKAPVHGGSMTMASVGDAVHQTCLKLRLEVMRRTGASDMLPVAERLDKDIEAEGGFDPARSRGISRPPRSGPPSPRWPSMVRRRRVWRRA